MEGFEPAPRQSSTLATRSVHFVFAPLNGEREPRDVKDEAQRTKGVKKDAAGMLSTCRRRHPDIFMWKHTQIY